MLTERYLTVKETCLYARVRPSTLHKWLKKHGLPFIQTAPRHKIRIDRLALDEFLKQFNQCLNNTPRLMRQALPEFEGDH